MENKRRNKAFWEGFNSALDLSGIGFSRRYRSSHNINNSWYNVGVLFNNSFNKYIFSEESDSSKICDKSEKTLQH